MAPMFEVSKDFFGKPFPMISPSEVNILKETQLHSSSVTRLAYSPSGQKLAAASID